MADIIVQSFQQAINLILNGNSDIYGTILRTVYVAGLGTLLACLWSIPIAVTIGLHSFRGKWVIKGLSNALIGIPTVALGLLLYLFFSRQGDLGFLNLLYTLNGMAIGDALLVTPIIVSFTANALERSDMQLRDLAKTLGASGFRTNLTLIRETFWSIVLNITAAFNRCFGELGIATLIGGNIFKDTTVLTTAIALQVNLGFFDYAMAYGIILMIIVIVLALIISLIERIKDKEGNLRKLIWWRRGLIGGS